MIAPISSWAAAVSGVASVRPRHRHFRHSAFRARHPLITSTLLTFVFIIAITFMKFDFGPMRLHEMSAQLNGDLGAL